MASIISAGTTSGTALNMAGDTSGVLQLATNGSTTALTINTSQNVGIGTTSPDGKLHVMTSSAGSVTADADADDLTIEGATNPGISILGTGDDVCSVYFGNPGSDGQKDGGIRYFQESFATVANRRSMTFITGTLERARIDSSGNLLVGGTSAVGSSRLLVKGSGSSSATTNIYVQNSSGTDIFYMRDDGAINTGTTTSSPYNLTTGSGANAALGSDGFLRRSTSSIKYKTDVQNAVYGLNEVMQLRPVTYKGKNDGNKKFGGLIAEEVDEIGLTEFVEYAEDGTPDALSYGHMVSLLTKAIQEQQTIINDLKARITALEGAA